MKDDLFKDVHEYIKLFTPVGWKADYLKWSDTVIKMFTEGYCFNFAKALKMTFDHKYKCAIVGTGRFETLCNPNNVWKLTSNGVRKAILCCEFNHYIVVMEDPDHPGTKQGFDICGVYSINSNDYDDTCIWCRTFDEKAELLDRLNCTDYDAEQQFARYYNLSELEGDRSYKVFWYLTDYDVDHYSKVMQQMELKTYNDC